MNGRMMKNYFNGQPALHLKYECNNEAHSVNDDAQ